MIQLLYILYFATFSFASEDSNSNSSFNRYYHGRFDDLVEILISLNCFEDECIGELVYLRSKQKFQLEGIIKGSAFKLQEIDYQDNISGYLEGTIDGANLSAAWYNYDRSRGAKIYAKKTDDSELLPAHCGNNKRFYIYKNDGEERENKLMFLLENESAISGTIYLENIGSSNSFRTTLHDRYFSIPLYNSSNLHIADANVSIKSNQVEIQTISKNEKRLKHKLELESSLGIDCIEYGDYILTYDISYPKTRNERLNQYLDSTFNKLTTVCENKMSKLLKKYPEPVPALRYTELITGRVELSFFDKYYASGIIDFGSTDTKINNSEAFIINLKKEDPRLNQSISRLRQILQKEKKDLLAQYLANSSFKENEQFKDWIIDDGIQHFTISSDGLNYSSNPHPVFGRIKLTIPWNESRKYISKNHPLYRYVK